MDMFREKINILAMWIVKIFGGGIMLFLLFYAMSYTHYMIPLSYEKAEVMKDNFLLNLVYLLLFIAFLFMLNICENRMGQKTKKILSTLLIVLATLWIIVVGFWWITSVDRKPESDPLYVSSGAYYFTQDLYFSLNPEGGYFAMYSHQLPLAALMELLFHILGSFRYSVYQALNVLFTGGITVFGYLMVREKSKKLCCSVGYVFTVVNCFPLVLYSSWVYGEIPCLFSTFFAGWTLYKYIKHKKGLWLLGTVFGLTMATATRQNAIIIIIAFCLLGIVYVLHKMDMKILVAIFASIICPILVYMGVFHMYEIRSGYDHVQGIPASAHIEMGLSESVLGYGAYDNSSVELFSEVEFDSKKTDAIERERIVEDIEQFIANPQYARVFFREKILSQWNNPLFQSMFFTTYYTEKNMPEQGTFVYKISNDYYFGILQYSNVIQMIIYFGVFLYFVLAIDKENNVLQHLFAVALIGGFLFSIIWEAKARYMFPYYVMMLPMANIGYITLITKVEKIRSNMIANQGVL